MSKHLKMWEFETVDENGNEGVDILLARDEAEAREKQKEYHRRCLCRIVNCESILGISLATVTGTLGETYYFAMKKKKEDGSTRTILEH